MEIGSDPSSLCSITLVSRKGQISWETITDEAGVEFELRRIYNSRYSRDPAFERTTSRFHDSLK